MCVACADGFKTIIESEVFPKGLSEDVVRAISAKKEEPEWLLEFRCALSPATGAGHLRLHSPMPSRCTMLAPEYCLIVGQASAKARHFLPPTRLPSFCTSRAPAAAVACTSLETADKLCVCCRLKAYRKWLTMEEPKWSDNRYPRIDFQVGGRSGLPRSGQEGFPCAGQFGRHPLILCPFLVTTQRV